MPHIAIFQGMPIWLLGFIFSLLAGLATGLGALAIFFLKEKKLKYKDAMMGFGAGVMLAATSFSLIVPSLEYAGYGMNAALIVVTGIMLGGGFILLSDRYIPHDFFLKGSDMHKMLSHKRTWIFILAITLHNFPEGLAVGVGFGTGDISNGIALAIGIGLQNIPEGLAVALALVANGYTRNKAFAIGMLSGMVEPIGGLIGAGLVTIFTPILPFALAFAAGAMLFVIVGEIIPESHKQENTRMVTLAVIIGFVIMLFLDVTLG
jgi:ZIP family zinc transporter